MQNLKENLEDEFKKLDENSSVRDLQEYTKKMIKVRGFDDETPQDIMLLLTEELGELAKEVRKSTHIKMDVNSNRTQNLDKEIADVFNYIMSLCVATNIDLFEAFKGKEEINLKREWK
jgi:NTP pyrophosphatase (non-canonical NTP hydrolase)